MVLRTVPKIYKKKTGTSDDALVNIKMATSEKFSHWASNTESSKCSAFEAFALLKQSWNRGRTTAPS